MRKCKEGMEGSTEGRNKGKKELTKYELLVGCMEGSFEREDK